MRPPIRKALLLSLKLKWSRHTTQVPHMRFLDLHTRWTFPNALATDSKASAVIAMCDIVVQLSLSIAKYMTPSTFFSKERDQVLGKMTSSHSAMMSVSLVESYSLRFRANESSTAVRSTLFLIIISKLCEAA